jgi:hypothetical protein
MSAKGIGRTKVASMRRSLVGGLLVVVLAVCLAGARADFAASAGADVHNGLISLLSSHAVWTASDRGGRPRLISSLPCLRPFRTGSLRRLARCFRLMVNRW